MNRQIINMLIAKVIVETLTDIIINEICCMNCEYYFVNDIITDKSYCSIHNEKLIHNKIIININTPIEIGYCYKCNKEYTEYSDINPIYISNYEHIVKELDDI